MFGTTQSSTLSPNPTTVSPNLVVNGSFEDTTTAAIGTRYRKSSSSSGWGTYDSILGWRATAGGKIEIQHNGVAGKASDGKNLLELDSDDYKKTIPVLGVFQDIQTVVGQSYTLSFMYSARPNTSATDNLFSVLVGNSGNLINQQLNGGVGGRQTNWFNYTTTFVADSNVTRLQFNYDGIRNTYGAYLDNVQVTAAAASYGGSSAAGYGGSSTVTPAASLISTSAYFANQVVQANAAVVSNNTSVGCNQSTGSEPQSGTSFKFQSLCGTSQSGVSQPSLSQGSSATNSVVNSAAKPATGQYNCLTDPTMQTLNFSTSFAW